mgnify:CR=1 FL=1
MWLVRRSKRHLERGYYEADTSHQVKVLKGRGPKECAFVFLIHQDVNIKAEKQMRERKEGMMKRKRKRKGRGEINAGNTLYQSRLTHSGADSFY